MAFHISKTEVERFCNTDKRFKTECPRCGKEIIGYPALSRFADVNICSDCGIEEAFESMMNKTKNDFTDWNLGRNKN